MLTDNGQFVGVRQEDADLDSLLDTYVDEDATAGDTVTVDGAIVPEWQEWSDAGGDHAYAASIGDYEILVYGPAPKDDLLTIVKLTHRRTGSRLTRRPRNSPHEPRRMDADVGTADGG